VAEDAFPGRRPDGVAQVWAKGSIASVKGKLRTAGVQFTNPITAGQALAAPGFKSESWALGFLQALGILTASLTVGGLLFYLAARQRSREVAVAVTRRMGLTIGQHRRSVTTELAAILLTGSVIGAALAYVAALLVYGRLDPLPAVPPAPILQVPLAPAGDLLIAALVVAWLCAVGVQWAAERADVSEVMRNVD
jgi:ABC-type lipoprotein release transport system permease subunit